MNNHTSKPRNNNEARVRVAKRNGYTIIPNGLLPEGKISARAWGIYSYLLSRPEGWDVRASHLATIFREGRDAIYKALKELVAAGLMELESYRNEDGLPRKRYVLLSPESVLYPPNPGFQDTGFQDTENTGEVITDLTTTELNQDLSVTSSNKFDDQKKNLARSTKGRTRPNPGNLTTEQRTELRNKLVTLGKLLQDGHKFYSEKAQDEWWHFIGMMEEAFKDDFDNTGMADLLHNGKWTVSAKVADPYEAGKELNKIIATSYTT